MAGTAKEYIEALNSFTYSLEQLVKTLQAKEAESGSGGGDVLEEFFTSSKAHFEIVEALAEDVKEIKDNVIATNAKSDEILKNVKAIKSKKEKGLFDTIEDADKKQTIVDGVKTIVLIAGAVLAIGAAFKLIGSVDFVSVLALSIALPLIAHAFAQIADIGELDYNTVISMGLMLIIMSTAMMLSSHVLSMTAKLKPEVIFTALAIGLIFTVVAYAVSMMIEALDDAGLKEVLLLGLVMVVVAAAIMVSSWLLQYVVPIPLWDVIIAAITIGIVSIVMAVTLWVIDKFLTLKRTVIGSIMLIIISAAIMISSHILALGNYDYYPSIDWALEVGLSVLMLAPAILLLGVPAFLPFVIIGSIMLIVVAAAIMTVSHILNAGVYENFPGPGWAFSVGLTMMLFGPITLVLGFIGLLWPIVMLGVELMYTIARTIVDISLILAQGNYKNAGQMAKWAATVVLLFTVFAPMILLLGGIAAIISVITFFGGDDPMYEGRKLLKQIAWTIVDLSLILSLGKYDVGPSAEWAYGVGYALTRFMWALNMAQPDDWNWWTGGGTTIEEKVANLKYAIYAMVEIAKYLGQVTGAGVFDPKKAPPKEWAEGVGISITKFMEALNTANDMSMWDSMVNFFGGDALGEKIQVLFRVIDVMVTVASYLNSKAAVFSRGPSKEWAEGVGGSILAFVKALTELSELDTNGSVDWWTGEKQDSPRAKLLGIVSLMVTVGKVLSKNADAFSAGPSKKWSDGIKAMVDNFVHIYDKLYDVDTAQTRLKLKNIAWNLVNVGNILRNLNKDNTDPILMASKGVNALATAFMRMSAALKSFGSSTKSITSDALEVIRGISTSIMALSAVDADNLENVMKKLKPEDIAKLYSMSVGAAEKSAQQRKSQESSGGWMNSLFGGGGGTVKQDPQTVEAKRQTKELVNIKNELVNLNKTVSAIALHTEEMLEVKSSGGNNATKITH